MAATRSDTASRRKGATRRASSDRHSAILRRLLRARWVRLGGSGLLFAFAIGILLHQTRDIRPAEIGAAVAATPPLILLLALGLTGGSYLCLAATEGFALRWLDHVLPWRRVAAVAATAYAVSNTVGFSLASGGMVRMRMYRADGLSGSDAARVSFLAGAAVTASGAVVAGAGLLVAAVGQLPALPAWPAVAAAVALMTPASLWFLVLRARRGGVFTVRARSVALLTGAGDWILSGAALYCFLPHPLLSAFPAFLAVYVLGSVFSAASGVPGGLGVFEAVIISMSGLVTAQVHETAAALLLYRLIYGFGPLALVLGAAASRRAAATRRRGERSP